MTHALKARTPSGPGMMTVLHVDSRGPHIRKLTLMHHDTIIDMFVGRGPIDAAASSSWAC